VLGEVVIVNDSVGFTERRDTSMTFVLIRRTENEIHESSRVTSPHDEVHWFV
jgi:hypothetical protein